MWVMLLECGGGGAHALAARPAAAMERECARRHTLPQLCHALELRQLKQQAAQRPHVRLGVVVVVGPDLGRHVVRRACARAERMGGGGGGGGTRWLSSSERLWGEWALPADREPAVHSLCARLTDLRARQAALHELGAAQVAQAHVRLARQEHVLGLDVPVQHVLVVQRQQALGDLDRVRPHRVLLDVLVGLLELLRRAARGAGKGPGGVGAARRGASQAVQRASAPQERPRRCARGRAAAPLQGRQARRARTSIWRPTSPCSANSITMYRLSRSTNASQ